VTIDPPKVTDFLLCFISKVETYWLALSQGSTSMEPELKPL
jgi:hypothetical protein